MLLVNARVGESAIHGLGLIARQFIPAGTIVWKFIAGFDIEIQESSLESLSPAAREQVIHYAEYHAASRKFVLSSDDDRFTNHSEDPNTRSRDCIMYALRDIHEGEEITCDYREREVEVHAWATFRPGDSR